MLLPKSCSLKVNGNYCQVRPSYIVSITAQQDEYMIGLVCDDHRQEIQKRLKALQGLEKVPMGNIRLQQIKMVMTDCVRSGNDDYTEIELIRNLATSK
ncbi:MAG: hypothetical protein JO327_05255 [Nitrososphaeraceae archaeon]|nr:hypothetical protein [Nitrososphaeraceae archaeon]